MSDRDVWALLGAAVNYDLVLYSHHPLWREFVELPAHQIDHEGYDEMLVLPPARFDLDGWSWVYPDGRSLPASNEAISLICNGPSTIKKLEEFSRQVMPKRSLKSTFGGPSDEEATEELIAMRSV